MENSNKHIDPFELLPRYFSKEASPQEIEQVEEWLAISEENKKEFRAFEKIWNTTGSVSELADIDIDAEWKKIELSITPTHTKIFTLRRIVQIAASIVLISTLAFIGLKYTATQTEKAPLAELKTITLPDGSTVSLNADSKISYQKGFGKQHRSINLKGEAYFEVEKNKNIPFIIIANEASIEVIGTKFNVKAYKNQQEVKVLVTEGTVKLYPTKNPAIKTTLLAGESASLNRAEKSVQKAEETNLNDIAWKTLIIDFKNTSLKDVANILENTYHIPIEIDAKVQNCPITVHFEKQDLVSILKVLKSTLDLQITAEENLIKISGAGC